MSFDKKPAVWIKEIELGQDCSVHVSEKGGVKITEGGKVVGMFSARQLETLHLAFTSMTPEQVQEIQNTAALSKEKVNVDKEINKQADRARREFQALADIARAKGLNPEQYIAQVLSGKAS